MALTVDEEARIVEIESTITTIQQVLAGAGSHNMLNRLHVLAQEQVENLKKRVDDLETDMAEVLDLARKLQ